MNKLNEMLIGTGTLVLAGAAFVTKRIWKTSDTLSDRITALEQTVVRKEDLSGIERDVSMIVTHLITKGKK